MVCGVFVRVISFPMGYFLLARGSSRLVLMAEALGGGATILLSLWLTSSRGLAGAGQAFLASSIIYTLCLAIILRAKAGRWVGRFTLLMCLSAALTLASAKGLTLFRPEWWWQSLLVAGISLACVFIYMRTVHREKSTDTNQAD
jgi:O-antigen/teichoic acid export membrane protein